MDERNVSQSLQDTLGRHPIHWSWFKKWSILAVYCLLEIFVTLSSTSYVEIEALIQAKYGGSTQVVTLGQSMYILGTAIGPLFLGPLSDVRGRKWVYVGSISFFALINIGCALAVDLPMLIVFQFLSGAAGSTSVTNVAGTVADLFGDSAQAGQPMALFVMSANIGPGVGPVIGELISDNTHMGRPWFFWINVIFGGAFAALMAFVPETLPRIVIRNTLKHDPSLEDDYLDDAAAPIEHMSAFRRVISVASMAIRILFTEPIVLFLGVFNGFAYGLLFLYLDGVFDVFVFDNGLSYMGADLTYLNFVVGAVLVFVTLPGQTYLLKRDRQRTGHARPEARFITSLYTVWLFPISLIWFAFTCDGNTNYWSPIVAGAVLGFCDPLLYLSMLNYITDTYYKCAASAVAAFSILSFGLAAGCAHIGIVMFDRMSAKWAMAVLGFTSFGLVALVYVLYFCGPELRKRSKLAGAGK